MKKPERATLREAFAIHWRAVKEIRISFEGEGQVAMDNIGLEKQGRGA